VQGASPLFDETFESTAAKVAESQLRFPPIGIGPDENPVDFAVRLQVSRPPCPLEFLRQTFGSGSGAESSNLNHSLTLGHRLRSVSPGCCFPCRGSVGKRGGAPLL